MAAMRSFGALASFAIVLWLLQWAKGVLIPISLAVMMAFILNPVVAIVERRGLNRIASVIVVTLLAFLFAGGVGLTLMLQIQAFGEHLPQYQDNILRKIASVRDVGQAAVVKNIEATVKRIEEQVARPEDGIWASLTAVPVRVQSSSLSQWSEVAGPTVEAFAYALLILVLVVSTLVCQEDLRGRLILLAGRGRLALTTRAMNEAAERVGRYLLMQVVVNLAFGVVFAVGLMAVGMPYAAMWGLLAAILRFVPFLGPWLLAALLTVFCIAVFPGWTQPLLALALFATLELATYHIAEPLVFGRSTGMIPIAVIIAAVVWTWLWGPVGLLLSTPLTTCLVVLGKHVPCLEFLDILLADGGALSPEMNYYQRLLGRDQDEAGDVVEQHVRDRAPETVYDEIFVPALARAKGDLAKGLLAVEDLQFIIRATREILEEVLSPQNSQGTDGGKAPASHSTAADPPQLVLLGCSAHDEVDELVLQMFRQLLGFSNRCVKVETLSPKTLVSEVVSQVKDRQAVAVCIAATPPGGMTQVRYLCKRLRAQIPEQKILVGRWGSPPEHAERIRNRLRDLRVNHPTTRLVDTRDQLLSWLPAPSAAL